MNTIGKIEMIATNPEVRSGRPFIVGTSVTVADVAIATIYHDKGAAEIAKWYDLTLAQVHAALAYYYEHKQEINKEIRMQIQRSEQLKEKRVGSRHSLLSGNT